MDRAAGSLDAPVVDFADGDSLLELLLRQPVPSKTLSFQGNAMKMSSFRTLLACACGSSMLLHSSASVAQSIDQRNPNPGQNERFQTSWKHHERFERLGDRQRFAADATPSSQMDRRDRPMYTAWRGEKDLAAQRSGSEGRRDIRDQRDGGGRPAAVRRRHNDAGVRSTRRGDQSRGAVAAGGYFSNRLSQVTAGQRFQHPDRSRSTAAGCDCNCPYCVGGQCSCSSGQCDCPSDQCGCRNGRCHQRGHSMQNTRVGYRGNSLTRRNSPAPRDRFTVPQYRG